MTPPGSRVAGSFATCRRGGRSSRVLDAASTVQWYCRRRSPLCKACTACQNPHETSCTALPGHAHRCTSRMWLTQPAACLHVSGPKVCGVENACLPAELEFKLLNSGCTSLMCTCGRVEAWAAGAASPQSLSETGVTRSRINMQRRH